MQSITESDAVTRFTMGERVWLGEYRGVRGDRIEWRDKTNGRPLTAVGLTHYIEFAGESVPVKERVPEGVSPEQAVALVPFKKGDKVLIEVATFSREKGLVSCVGVLRPVVTGASTTASTVNPQAVGAVKSR